jgi:hypothetical protein
MLDVIPRSFKTPYETSAFKKATFEIKNYGALLLGRRSLHQVAGK